MPLVPAQRAARGSTALVTELVKGPPPSSVLPWVRAICVPERLISVKEPATLVTKPYWAWAAPAPRARPQAPASAAARRDDFISHSQIWKEPDRATRRRGLPLRNVPEDPVCASRRGGLSVPGRHSRVFFASSWGVCLRPG